MSTVTTSWIYLAEKPGSNYRQLFIRGRNIAARTLYSLHVPGEDWPGLSPEEIAEGYDLPVEAVREAIAYCQSNPPEIQTDREREESLLEATGMNEPGYKLHPSPRLLSPEERHRVTRR